MKKVLVATVLTASQDDAMRRVKLSSPNIWDETPLVASVNGLFLRVGEKVYVEVSEDYNDPLIIGRVGNWIDGDEILTLFNKLVGMINENVEVLQQMKKIYDNHTHVSEGAPATAGGGTATPSFPEAEKKDDIVIDEIFHVDNK